MAVPKRRTSSARRNRRRAHSRMVTPNLVPCPQCHELKPSHRVCLGCGYYKNKEALKVD